MANIRTSAFARRRRSVQTSRFAPACRRSASCHPQRDGCIAASEGADHTGSLQHEPPEPPYVNSALSKSLFVFARATQTVGLVPALATGPTRAVAPRDLRQGR